MGEKESGFRMELNDRTHIQLELLKRFNLHGEAGADWMKLHYKEIADIIDTPEFAERMALNENEVLDELEERFRPTIPLAA